MRLSVRKLCEEKFDWILTVVLKCSYFECMLVNEILMREWVVLVEMDEYECF